MRSLPYPLPDLVPASHAATPAYTPAGRRQVPGRPVSRSHVVVAWCPSPPCPCCSDRRMVPRSRSLSCLRPCPRARVPLVSCCRPSSRGYSPSGRPLPPGAGPRDPFPSWHRSTGRSLLLSFHSWDRRPCFLLCPVAPFLSCAPPSTPVYIPPGRKLPCGAGPRVCLVPLALVAPIRTPAAFSLCVVCFLVFFCPSSVHTPWTPSPPTSLCVSVPCPVVSCFCYPPLSMHARHRCTGRLLLRTLSVHVTGPLAPAEHSPWRSPAKPGGRPSLVSTSLRSPPRPTPVARLPPVPLTASLLPRVRRAAFLRARAVSRAPSHVSLPALDHPSCRPT